MKYMLSGAVNLTRDKASQERIGYAKAAQKVLEDWGMTEQSSLTVGEAVKSGLIVNDIKASTDESVHGAIVRKCFEKKLRRSLFAHPTHRRYAYPKRVPKTTPLDPIPLDGKQAEFSLF